MATRTDKTEEWLDQLDPAATPSRDATHLRTIAAATTDVEVGQERLVLAVAAARAAGESWTLIGTALGTTRQAAEQRFGRQIRAIGTPDPRSNR